MDNEQLKKFVLQHNIEKRTNTAFLKLLKNYRNENPEEYKQLLGSIKLDELSFQLHTISLNLGNWPECNYNTVTASMWVHYKDKQVATYKAVYTLDGEAEDDFFDIN